MNIENSAGATACASKDTEATKPENTATSAHCGVDSGSPSAGNAAVGVQGYDLVSYRNGKKPIPGNGNFLSTHKGVTYLFANQANKEAFDESAEKYVPAYGGYCAFGVSVNKKFIGDPTVWKVVNDRLYLNLDTGIQEMWLADVPGKIAQADNNWQAIENKSPSDL